MFIFLLLMSIRLRVILFFLSMVFLIIPWAFLDAATLKLSPTAGAYKIGDTFSVHIFLNTQNLPIEGADIHFLNYNPAILEVMDDDPAMPGVQIMAGNLMPVTPANMVDVAAGKIVFSQSSAGGGVPFSNSTDQLLATIHFRVKNSGYASVVFDYAPGRTDDANVVSKAKEALTSVANAAFTLGNPLIPGESCFAYAFSRNLRLGMRGDDVKMLQAFLNGRGFVVAISGSGSVGQETTYFGMLTKLALIKFQEAYMNEILIPAGLQKGSGYFGDLTRKKISLFGGSCPNYNSNSSGEQAKVLQEQLRALQDKLNRLKGDQ